MDLEKDLICFSFVSHDNKKERFDDTSYEASTKPLDKGLSNKLHTNLFLTCFYDSKIANFKAKMNPLKSTRETPFEKATKMEEEAD